LTFKLGYSLPADSSFLTVGAALLLRAAEVTFNVAQIPLFLTIGTVLYRSRDAGQKWPLPRSVERDPT
jgi:hypothetical protein